MRPMLGALLTKLARPYYRSAHPGGLRARGRKLTSRVARGSLGHRTATEAAAMVKHALLTLLVFLFSPVQNPWYLCWVVPFLCLFPSRAWILLTGLVSLYYLDFYFDYQDLQSYRSWIEWVEYTPFFLLLGWEFKLKKYPGSKSTLRSS